jgi:hypothetical protein
MPVKEEERNQGRTAVVPANTRLATWSCLAVSGGRSKAGFGLGSDAEGCDIFNKGQPREITLRCRRWRVLNQEKLVSKPNLVFFGVTHEKNECVEELTALRAQDNVDRRTWSGLIFS